MIAVVDYDAIGRAIVDALNADMLHLRECPTCTAALRPPIDGNRRCAIGKSLTSYFLALVGDATTSTSEPGVIRVTWHDGMSLVFPITKLN